MSTEPQQPKRSNRTMTLTLIVIILILLLLLRSCQGDNQPSHPTTPRPPQQDTSAIVDGEIELKSSQEIKADLQSKVDASYMNLKININPIFKAPDYKGHLYIQNSKINQSAIQVRIYLVGTQETIYQSPVLQPNQSILEDKLTTPLNPGKYEAIALFEILEPISMAKVGETAMKLLVTVQ